MESTFGLLPALAGATMFGLAMIAWINVRACQSGQRSFTTAAKAVTAADLGAIPLLVFLASGHWYPPLPQICTTLALLLTAWWVTSMKATGSKGE